MQHAIIIQSNGKGKNELEDLLSQGYTLVSVTVNNSPSYNDFLVILEDHKD
jgi:hypothetical protein